MPIQGIKLVTGEELVASVTATAGGVIVKNPLLVMMSRGKDGFIVNFLPWTMIAGDDINIEGHAIVARYDVPKDVQDSYIQNTTGLQIVSSAPTQILKG